MIKIIKMCHGSSEEGHEEGDHQGTEKERETLRWKELDGKNKI